MTSPSTPAPSTTRRLLPLATGIAVLLLLVAFAGGAVGYALGSDGPPRPMAGRTGWAATGDLDEESFLADMVAHHQEAITAARELRRSDRAEMRALGRSIVTSQTEQVEQMRAWSRAWFGSEPDSDYEPMMRDLDDLEGDRLDEVFLVDMVQHHMAAVMMSRRLLAAGEVEHPRLGDLARDIVGEQSEEIVRMQEWLREWFDEAWFDEGMMPGRGPMMGGLGS